MDGFIILLPLAFLALIFFSSRRRQREAATVQSSLKPGVEVITTAGLYATVVEVEDVAVVLETSPGVRSRWARASIGRVTSPVERTDPAAPADPADPDDRVSGAAVPDDLAALDPDRQAGPDGTRPGDAPGTGSKGSTGGAVRGPDLTKRDGGAGGTDDPGGRRP